MFLLLLSNCCSPYRGHGLIKCVYGVLRCGMRFCHTVWQLKFLAQVEFYIPLFTFVYGLLYWIHQITLVNLHKCEIRFMKEHILCSYTQSFHFLLDMIQLLLERIKVALLDILKVMPRQNKHFFQTLNIVTVFLVLFLAKLADNLFDFQLLPY